MRGANGYPKAVKSSTNPGGVGHAWVKARFIDLGAPDTVHALPTGTRLFLPSRLMDNRFLMEKDPGYLARLENLAEADRPGAARRGLGRVRGPVLQRVQPGSARVQALCAAGALAAVCKPGLRHGHAGGVLVRGGRVGPRGGLPRGVRGAGQRQGHGGRGHIISAAAARLLEANGGDEIAAWLAPPDLWNRRQETGRSAADIFAEQGVTLTKTGNDRAPAGLRCGSGWR